jgi:hypothetical protein
MSLDINKNNVCEENKNKASAFLCAVCYVESEEESGLVKPMQCSHKICMECFSRIIMEHKEESKCPECRTLYLKQDNNSVHANSSTASNASNENLNFIHNNEIPYGQLNWNEILNSVNNTLNLNNIATYYEIDNYYYVEDRNGNLFITLN